MEVKYLHKSNLREGSIKFFCDIAKGCPDYISSVVELLTFFFFTICQKYIFIRIWSVTIWVFVVLSQFELLSFVTIGVVKFGHNLSFWVLSQFELLIFFSLTIWVFFTTWDLEFSLNMSFEVAKMWVFNLFFFSQSQFFLV